MPLTKVQSGMISGVDATTLTGVVPIANGGTGGTAGVTGFKNRFINGDMTIAQRSVGPVNNSVGGLGYDTIDRWGYWAGNTNQFSIQQSSTVPTGAGFTYSALITSLGAITQTASTYATYSQRIEGYNIADLNWGTANAKTVTVSFWIRSSLTGTFSAYIFNSGYSYCFPFTFSIPSANTWVQITQTITGPTSGTWLTTNGIGLEFGVTLLNGTNYMGPNSAWTTNSYAIGVSGSVNLLGTNGATMYLTGVQLEVGSAATNFDFRSIGTETALCQRYCNIFYGGTYGSFMIYGSVFALNIALPVTMRTQPTFSTNINDSNFVVGSPNSSQWAMYIQNSGWNSYSGSINTLSMNGTPTTQSWVQIGTYNCTLGTSFTAFLLGGTRYFSFTAEL
jgi:hypothetical protein